MKVCFVVESLDISGGIYVVLQHLEFMRRTGADVVVAMTRVPDDRTATWHPALVGLDVKSLEEAASDDYDLAIATWWSTAYHLHRIKAQKHIYFVQLADYLAQPLHLRDQAERTYHLGLDAITVSASLGQELTEHYGTTTRVALNGIDKSIFAQIGAVASPRKKDRLRVLIEGPLGSHHKNVAYAIGLAKQAQADEIWLLTSSRIRWYPGVDRVFSRLNASECAAVYRSCDVLLKLSTLETCCLPNLEMFHCGGTVVAYDIPGPNEYLVHGENSLMLSVGDERGVVQALRSLKCNPDLLKALKSGAQATAHVWPTWEQSSASFHQHCRELMQKSGPSLEELRRKSERKPTANNAAYDAGTPMAGIARMAKSLIRRNHTLEEIKTLLRAVILEQRETPRLMTSNRSTGL